MKKYRNSNIEILRIISILFIVISHYTVHNGISNASLDFGINRYLLEIMTLGNIGTVLFVLITGYYMVNSKKIKLSKLINLWLQIWMYSFVIYTILCFTGQTDFSIKSLIKCLLPIAFDQYWFATVYVILYIFHPFLNRLIENLNRKEHLLLIVIGISIFSILHTVTTGDFYGNELIQFFLFYCIGAYFGKYNNSIFKSNRLNFILIFLCSLIMLFSVFAFDIIGIKIAVFSNHNTFLLNRTSPFVILFSICLFNVFINKKEFNNSLINIVASGVFGIYLISDNRYMRSLLWNDIFLNSNYVSSNFLILHTIFSVCSTFIVCCLIDLIRIYTIDKIYKKYFSKKIDLLQEHFELKYNNIISKNCSIN